MNKTLLVVGLGSLAMLAGCASEPDEYDVESYDSISSPAAVYCVQQEGKLASFTENNKRVKYCVFSEDEKYEVWEYYNENHEKEQQAK